jgi:hypothetical protein
VALRSSHKRLSEARSCAADTARADYSNTFSRVFDETLAELLAEQKPEAAA